MRKFFYGQEAMYVSSDDWLPEYDFWEKRFHALKKRFLRRPTYREILAAWQEKTGLEGCLLLEAHAGTKNGVWTFQDGKRSHRMQQFIDQHDGQYAALLLYSCNPHGKTVQSKKSIVIHPLKTLHVCDATRGGAFHLYVPGEGYLSDDSYQRNRIL